MNSERRQYFADLIARGNNQEVLSLLADHGQTTSDAKSISCFFCGVACQNLGRLDEEAKYYEEAVASNVADLLQIWSEKCVSLLSSCLVLLMALDG